MSPDARDGPAYPIGSVDNVLRLLLLLRDRQAVRLSEASDHLGVGRSTAHRLLAMLLHHGFVVQDPDTRRYAAGPALVDVGLAAMRGIDVRAAARPVLVALEDELRETCHVTTLVGTALVFLESVESRRVLRTGARAGVSLPAHCTSAGKILLSGMPAEVVAQLYGRDDLVAMTARSPISLRDLEHELRAVRARGWATNLGESESDVGAVAVGVATPAAVPRLALAVSAPLPRLAGADHEHMADVLRFAAADLGARLAHA